MDWASSQLIIGTLIGAAASAAVTLITTHWTRRAERPAREEARASARADLRRAAYVAFVVQVQGLGDEAAAWRLEKGKGLKSDEVMAAYYRDLGASSHEYDRCEAVAKLAAGPAVLQVLDGYIDWYRTAIGQTIFGKSPGLRGSDDRLATLLAAMRFELNEDMSIPSRKGRPG